MGWRITFDGQVYNRSDLSITDCDELDRTLGESWVVLHPGQSPMRLARITAWLHAKRTDADYDELVKKVCGLSVDTLIGALGEETDDLPTEYQNGFPQPADVTETTG